MAIAVTPDGGDRDERRLSGLAAVALGIVIGLFVYALIDAYIL